MSSLDDELNRRIDGGIMSEASDWLQHRLLVMNTLRQLGEDLRSISGKMEELRVKDIAQIKSDIVLLKFQAAMWGSVGGVIATGVATAILKLVLK